ncbi:acyltransferase [Kiritimatiellota bacterium B12222]|nr:acyltransferase [Kiritimatiellota bacterium B12222]
MKLFHYIKTLYLKESIFLYVANNLPRLRISDKVRWLLYKYGGINISGPSRIFGPLIIRPIGSARNIYIGSGTFINTETRFGASNSEIHIGRNVMIGPRVMFETFNHDIMYDSLKGRGGKAEKIVIEDEVWIAAGAIILPGVKIGKGAVVAAGAVVNKNVKPFTLVGGVPAKLLREDTRS